jgi:type IV secretory pathway component VirB8
LERLPALWRGPATDWLTLKLKDDLETVASLDKEFALFMESEKQRTDKAFQHARLLKLIATLLTLAILAVVAVGAIVLLRKNPHLLGR